MSLSIGDVVHDGRHFGVVIDSSQRNLLVRYPHRNVIHEAGEVVEAHAFQPECLRIMEDMLEHAIQHQLSASIFFWSARRDAYAAFDLEPSE